MAVKERNQQLRIVAEILLVHIPEQLAQDPALAHDLMSVAATALRSIFDDAEKSTKAWDKKAYHVRADKLRREWDWSMGASNYALGLALRLTPLRRTDIAKLRLMIGVKLQKPARRQIADPKRFQGAAQAVRQLEAQRKKPVRW
jgi:hypothetical protein